MTNRIQFLSWTKDLIGIENEDRDQIGRWLLFFENTFVPGKVISEATLSRIYVPSFHLYVFIWGTLDGSMPQEEIHGLDHSI